MGVALGQTQSLKAFICQACNLYQADHMQLLITNMLDNTSLEIIDFSDNDLRDEHGEYITTLIKHQSVQRDNEIWKNSLRQETAEEYMKYQMMLLNQAKPEAASFREIDSTMDIKRMLDNLDNHEMQTPAAILE